MENQDYDFNQEINKEQELQEKQPLTPVGPLKVSKVFSIISCIVGPIYSIATAGVTEEPLAIIMAIISSIATIIFTVIFCSKIKNEKPISTGFRVCMLIFISPISGALALSDRKWPRR